MSSIQKNLSSQAIQLKRPVKIGIVQSEYNSEITDALAASCLEELQRSGVKDDDITHKKVPGAWELAIAAQKMAQKKQCEVIICVGLILKGETPHFDFIASATAKGIMDVSLKFDLPIIFGVLTTHTLQQAQARIKGGMHGDKGVEAAQAALKMIDF